MAPLEGRCLCGGAKITFEGEPAMKALCHCKDCQQITGSAFSTNIVAPEGTTKYSGTKEYKKTADSGSSIISHFCPTCGTTLVRTSETFPGMVIIKAGVLDGGLELAKPDGELFTPNRAAWVTQVSGTQQHQAMPS